MGSLKKPLKWLIRINLNLPTDKSVGFYITLKQLDGHIRNPHLQFNWGSVVGSRCKY